MSQESYDLIKIRFEHGIYTLQDMVKFVEDHVITKEDFHFITSYSYKAFKKRVDD